MPGTGTNNLAAGRDARSIRTASSMQRLRACLHAMQCKSGQKYTLPLPLPCIYLAIDRLGSGIRPGTYPAACSIGAAPVDRNDDVYTAVLTVFCTVCPPPARPRYDPDMP